MRISQIMQLNVLTVYTASADRMHSDTNTTFPPYVVKFGSDKIKSQSAGTDT